MPKLYRRQPGGNWHFDLSGPNGRIRRSTGTQDKKVAERIAAKILAAEWKRHTDGPQATVTFAQAALEYRRAEKPIRFLDRIEDYWRDKPIRDIKPGAIRQSALALYPSAGGATRNRQVIVPTMAIINHAADLGWCSPVKVKRFPIDPAAKTPATREWVEAFADQAAADRLPHLAALCLFMFGTAVRIGEATRLAWRDVDLAARTATLRGAKPTPWTRTVHLAPPVVVAMANIPSNRNPDENVFCYAHRQSCTTAWNAVIERADIERLTPHCCRHGFATSMLQAGVDVKTVAARGGWKDAATVLRTYAHAIEDRTVTDVLFDTNPAHAKKAEATTDGKKRIKSK